MSTQKIYDIIGVGIGPFNLGLACLTDPIEEIDALFLDKSDGFDWHPGMLLESTTLQIPFMADLVTLADPTSPFSFLNYVKKQGRMYSFYIKENFLVLRNEYNKYCQWVVEQLSTLQFSSEVTYIVFDEKTELYQVTKKNTSTQKIDTLLTKKLVFGTGTTPYIPSSALPIKDKVIHTANYIQSKERLQQSSSVTVLGSGQSAAEVFYDLLSEIDNFDYSLNWITRSSRFFPMEYGKLTLEMTSPEYVDYFFGLDKKKRTALLQDHKHLYKGINEDLINEIFDLIYAKKLMNKELNISLRTNSTLVNSAASGDKVKLAFRQEEEGKYYQHETDLVLAATGYKAQMPTFIHGIEHLLRIDHQGNFNANRNYTVDHVGNSIFVQNAELNTHGFVTPDLGMGAYRNSYIIREITGKEYYPIEEKIAFQKFSVSADEEIDQPNAILENALTEV
ncbi:SidA/IucD/PvdA family monooxygenase [Flammeovirga yaeyamensis]|uniref:SidA/IucD/PvdA family monooxygenase n=1 Tax=Flammeovirga yaeyamensis TaxID=367791 RepID=A0AAX1N5T0_9BACT|nr:SidA/IucD/PvdA family monooxygenase [Flammeovirga yaeyamensis]MBB3698222.1 lysine N6-hydroxylase [Flammeovirga yaeyamensis]NMF34423.1 SidA/IucD/PvdA family monooxygenase [Flammeovirga yaeyamensis]QWG01402.1 SidA/IucD/PvdA family monooxygenase [Flammeovirga yaeyamensis]